MLVDLSKDELRSIIELISSTNQHNKILDKLEPILAACECQAQKEKTTKQQLTKIKGGLL